MRRIIILVFIVYPIVLLPIFLEAQEPQWELLFPDVGVFSPITVDPSDSDIIYIATLPEQQPDPKSTGMLKSTDGGDTWDFYSEGWFMGHPKHILVNPDNPDEILVCGGEGVGVQKSTDGGETWIRADNGILLAYKVKEANELPLEHQRYEASQLAYDRNRGLYYLADISLYGGLYRSEDGVNWTRIRGGQTYSVVIDESNGDIYIAADRRVYVSRDDGETWEETTNGLPDSQPILYRLAKVPESNTLYVTTSQGIYKTVDGGENWFSVNDSVMSELAFRGGLAVSRSDTNTVIAGGGTRAGIPPPPYPGIFISRNSGTSWQQYHLGFPDSAIAISSSYLFLDNVENTLYASVGLSFENAPIERHVYRLRNAITSVIDKYAEELPDNFILRQNYPNPFNSSTNIKYELPQGEHVKLEVYDVLGRLIKTLVDETQQPGVYRVTWNASDVAGGIYIYRIIAGNYMESKSMLLIQ